jgi:cobalt-zinc-cadmium efflux system membrane fusion protein
MKYIYKLLSLVSLSILLSCSQETTNQSEEKEHDHDHQLEEMITLTDAQVQSLKIKMDTMQKRNLSNYVETNGQLEVPPQNEATVTTLIGANISSIKVIEGDKVKRGEVLAYLKHPNLIELQTQYSKSWNNWKFLSKEYNRQKKLYAEKVSSGKDFQRTEAEYNTAMVQVKGLEAKLKLLGLNPEKIQMGDLFEQTPLKSPIDGYVRLVEVKTGQYVDPQTELFEIVNIDHVHADFMVFEKDMHKVKKGQKIRFSTESMGDNELEAVIYSVGKAFETEPKAIHLHAEIENKQGLLIPGVYVRGRILLDGKESYALPQDAIVMDKGIQLTFAAHKHEGNWEFTPTELKTGKRDNGWVEIISPSEQLKKIKIIQNGAYQLLAEWRKEESEHSH